MIGLKILKGGDGLEVTTAEEYRRGKQEVVELPSGARFKIRKMSPLEFGKLMEVLGTAANAPDSLREAQIRDRIVDVMRVLIPGCVVEPKISFESKEGCLSFEELEVADAMALMDAVYEFSGLAAEDAEERRKFRAEPSG